MRLPLKRKLRPVPPAPERAKPLSKDVVEACEEGWRGSRLDEHQGRVPHQRKAQNRRCSGIPLYRVEELGWRGFLNKASQASDAQIAGEPSRTSEPFGLDLGSCVLPVGWIKELTRFQKLSALNLSQYPVNGPGEFVSDLDLAEIGKLTELRLLRFGSCEFTDTGIRHLVGLTHLRVLEFSNANLTEDGLVVLANFPELESLSLANVKFTPAGAKYFAKLPQLQSLDLSNTNITDGGMQHLAGLVHLRDLNLYGTADHSRRAEAHRRLGQSPFAVAHRSN